MPPRGNPSRPEKNRLPTVLGLVLAIAMVSTVSVPGLALADKAIYQDRPGTDILDGGVGNTACEKKSSHAFVDQDTPITTEARAKICWGKLPRGCSITQASVEIEGTLIEYDWRLYIESVTRRHSFSHSPVYRKATLDTSHIDLDWGDTFTVRASVVSIAVPQDSAKVSMTFTC